MATHLERVGNTALNAVPVVAQFWLILAMLAFLMLNGHLVLISAIVETFSVLPVATDGLTRAGAWELVSWASRMFAAGVLMYFMSAGLREARVAADPPLPKLPEARQPYEVKGPRLQADPPADMRALRQQENETLNQWGWTDETNGVARIPIERAMEMLVEQRSARGEEDGS